MARGDRASNRPRRAGSGPPNNTPRGGAGKNRPNSGASVGGTGFGTTHKGSAKKKKSCAAKMVIAVPLTLFYAVPRAILARWIPALA